MDYAANIPTRLSKWLYLAVFIVGALTVFAFAPFKLYPLAWFGPAFLFYALTKAKTKAQYFKLGWVYGLGLFGVGTSWPFYSLYFYAKAHIVVAVLGTSLFVAFVALFSTGLFGLLASLFRHHSLFLRLLLFFPASWVLAEWFRTWLFTGFPWLFLGNTQIDSYFSAIAPVTGVLGVSFICALIAGTLLSFYLGNSVRRAVHIEPDPVTQMVSNRAFVEEHLGPSVRILSVFIIVMLVGVSFALNQINWTEKKGKPITVSVLQSNIPQEVKLQPSSLLPSIDLYKEMTRKSRDSDLIVWPETALFDSFDRHIQTVIAPLQKSLKGTNKAILMGGFYINDEQGVENSVLAITADNRSIYSKRHLVPFGEYTPLLKYLRWLNQWIQLPYDNVAKGKNNGILKINDHTVQMTICYEDAFGAEMITALPEADYLINVTHDGWFTGSFEPYQHMQIARMRSLEMGRYMVRSTTNGPAGIIDEKGKVLATAPIYTQSIITNKVQPMKGTTPYVRWGNWLIVILMSTILLLGILFKRKE
ncbi:MAG: apolipoprotein N-acyltransferase [Cocleimonas sp.]